jgi:hypothetical protein
MNQFEITKEDRLKITESINKFNRKEPLTNEEREILALHWTREIEMKEDDLKSIQKEILSITNKRDSLK